MERILDGMIGQEKLTTIEPKGDRVMEVSLATAVAAGLLTLILGLPLALLIVLYVFRKQERAGFEYRQEVAKSYRKEIEEKDREIRRLLDRLFSWGTANRDSTVARSLSTFPPSMKEQIIDVGPASPAGAFVKLPGMPGTQKPPVGKKPLTPDEWAKLFQPSDPGPPED